MWISKKKWQQLEKRVADLEEKIQSQPKEIHTEIKVDEIPEKRLRELMHAIEKATNIKEITRIRKYPLKSE